MPETETNEDVNVCISSFQDPMHCGHLEYMVNARKLIKGNGKLIVIVNNDKQAILKKGREFMPRMFLRTHLRWIKKSFNLDHIFLSLVTT